ncbi:MAG: DNA phosphorothioation-dependent restriction protein DptF [Gammaproteobacteria bacterium]|nr:DNA phosphorothioation-dependent restriction protein DptF [Gammaproteobacteria bacterium]
MLGLRDALSVLDKSSPHSVSTDFESNDLELNEIKSHLYIETEIERAFGSKLSQLRKNDFLFLCGSSGDGKSEILTRYKSKYNEAIDFHLDATHSFEPQSTAIETLDKLFSRQKETERPLVVGINIGMLGNYGEEGASNHDGIKNTIRAFLNTKVADQKQCYFLDFEAFPKFDLASDPRTSEFVQQLLTKITENSDSNPLYKLYEKELGSEGSMLCANYQLLSIPSVQSIIIGLLLKARLVKDQFITARSLLDFVHHLLTSPHYIFDNLFSKNDGELGGKVATFDPCAIRKRSLDMFILERELGLPVAEFDVFVHDLTDLGIEYRNGLIDQYSLIRLFFLLKDEQFSNNYHFKYKADFDDELIDQYARIWCAHSDYDGNYNQRAELKRFYKDIVLAAINHYANRNACELGKEEFFVSAHDNWNLAVELELAVNYNAIKEESDNRISFFLAYIKVAEQSLRPVPISINLLSLMSRIVQGYRPNKHDKNTIVLLDEIVEQIVKVANSSNVLYLHTGSKKIKIKKVDDEDIEVSGM